MFKKSVLLSVLFLAILLPAIGSATPPHSISIAGAVKQPLHLTLDDLGRFESVSARLNEVSADKTFRGAFTFRGVPLRSLLDLAVIKKENSDFSKSVDLAIIVRNKDGQQTVLSWGEIYYRNPADILIAYSATPVRPHRECSNCHTPEVFNKWLAPLNRAIGFPKLVVVNDFYADRSLENIVSVEVIDLRPAMTAKKLDTLFSPGFVIEGAVKEKMRIEDISSYTRLDILVKQTGDGKGYHGLRHFSGAPLVEMARNAGIKPDLNTVFLISAPDGYRSLISYGELILAPYGRNIIIADSVDNEPLRENGKFIALLPDDLSADRWVKAVEKVDVINIK